MNKKKEKNAWELDTAALHTYMPLALRVCSHRILKMPQRPISCLKSRIQIILSLPNLPFLSCPIEGGDVVTHSRAGKRGKKRAFRFHHLNRLIHVCIPCEAWPVVFVAKCSHQVVRKSDVLLDRPKH